MIPEITFVEALTAHRLRLRFSDGLVGEVDVRQQVSFTGVFSDLQDADYFARVTVDPESGTIVWPNGADLDPLVLYAQVSGRELDDLLRPDDPHARTG